MSKLPLPDKSEPYSLEGFAKLYESVRGDPANAKLVADALDANPRNVLEEMFTLSSSQQAALNKASDQHLRHSARLIVEELRSKVPGGARIVLEFVDENHDSFAPPKILSCGCFIPSS